MVDLRFLELDTDGPGPASSSGDGQTADAEALDAYSRVVTAVAEQLIPSVANLRVARGSRRGPGNEGVWI